MGQPPNDIPALEKQLGSWKEIAVYLNRDVTTVQRWEKREGMPVHRHVHDKRGSVYALPGELDEWVQSRRMRVEEPAIKAEPELVTLARISPSERPGRRNWFRPTLVAIVCICLAAAWWLANRYRPVPKAESKIRSLAVLPLRNLSGDPGEDYLADGITEALIGRLAGIHDLRVTSHTSVMRFKDPQQSVPQIARALGVDAVVEGSVIKEGDRIRVTAQLIRGATDEHFWSETYDRQMRDALGLESELAVSIGKKVEATVTGAEEKRLSAARVVAPEVYESYLKGTFALNQGTRPAIDESIRDFNAAVKADDTFAPAYVGLALAYSRSGTVFAGLPPSATRPKVRSLAAKALALDPDIVEAHVLLAAVLREQWHWSEAEEEYMRALALNPNDADANADYGFWLSCQGRSNEAISWVQRARALDPAEVSGDKMAFIFFHAHRYDDAIRESRSALAVQPDNALTLMDLGFELIADGKPAEAIPVLERARTLSPGSPAVTGVLVRAYAHAGRRDDAMRLLAELKVRETEGYVPAAAFVNAYLGLDDKEQAFHWLEEAFKEQSNILQFLKTHPYFDPIRGDPRFSDLVHRVGLE